MPPPAGSVIKAAISGDVAKIRSLLDRGAYIDDQDRGGFAALHYAVANHHLQVVDLLLQRGANVDVRCNCGKTPLYYAVQYKFETIVMHLLHYNANVDARDSEGSTPTSLAYSLKSRTVLNAIVDRTSDVNQLCGMGMTPIERAVARGHIYLTRLLVNRGAKVNYITVLRMSVLYMSCFYCANNAEMIECVLKGGADPNEFEPDGTTPFHYVLEHAEINIIQLMLNYGGSLETTTKDGRTPLHSASLNNHTSVLKMILDKGADVNARTVHGVTVLETSLHSRSREVVAYLIWKGAEYSKDMISNMMVMPLNYSSEKERTVLKRIALEDYENTLSDKIKKMITTNITVSLFLENCKAELAQLSKINVNEGYSAVDIMLISEERQFVELVVGCEIKEIFDKNMFPMYHSTYLVIFSKDLEDVITKENTALLLSEILNVSSRRHLIITKIINYLTVDDLKHLSPKR